MLSRDHENRCGNCHTLLKPDDKYCRKCGTERGKGKFEPFDNSSYAVYGPQIKVKYRCNNCNNIWITGALGGDYSRYCPMCGVSRIVKEQDEVCDFHLFGYVGERAPFEEENRPVLLKENQVDRILDNKKTEKTSYEDIVAPSDLQHIADVSGIEVPKDIDYEMLTEEEGERLNLIARIMLMQGTDPKGYKEAVCPNCRSKYAAAIGYNIWNREYNELLEKYVCKETVSNNAMVYLYGGNWRYNKDKPGKNHPAYICLCCGIRYGKFDLPKGWVEKGKILDIKKCKLI